MSLGAMALQRPQWLESGFIRPISQNHAQGDPMYGPAARCKSLRRVGGERSCINVSGL
jgi:hypothetical protein